MVAFSSSRPVPNGSLWSMIYDECTATTEPRVSSSSVPPPHPPSAPPFLTLGKGSSGGEVMTVSRVGHLRLERVIHL